MAGLGFVVMFFAARNVVAGGGSLLVSPWWLVGSYFLQTVGELTLSPVGLSSMTKLSPRKYVGQMMGIWFTASALGNLVAGLVGGHVDPEQLDQMRRFFDDRDVAPRRRAGSRSSRSRRRMSRTRRATCHAGRAVRARPCWRAKRDRG